MCMVERSGYSSSCSKNCAAFHRLALNNNNNTNNNNGNFICVFECTIVNLATYRQFTNAA